MRLIATQPAPLYPLLNFARLVQFSRGLLAAATQGLAGLTAIAVVAAGSAVVNTVRMNLLTRRGEIATLRTLGASVGQVEGIFFRQALLNGVVGSFIGTAGGWLFAWSMAHAAGVTTGLPLASPGFDVEVAVHGWIQHVRVAEPRLRMAEAL